MKCDTPVWNIKFDDGCHGAATGPVIWRNVFDLQLGSDSHLFTMAEKGSVDARPVMDFVMFDLHTIIPTLVGHNYLDIPLSMTSSLELVASRASAKFGSSLPQIPTMTFLIRDIDITIANIGESKLFLGSYNSTGGVDLLEISLGAPDSTLSNPTLSRYNRRSDDSFIFAASRKFFDSFPMERIKKTLGNHQGEIEEALRQFGGNFELLYIHLNSPNFSEIYRKLHLVTTTELYLRPSGSIASFSHPGFERDAPKTNQDRALSHQLSNGVFLAGIADGGHVWMGEQASHFLVESVPI